jgi:hypothetical protein
LQDDPACARARWGLGRIEMLASRKVAARNQIARAFQLDPRDPDIVLTYAGFVEDHQSQVRLALNFLALTAGNDAYKSQREEVTARLQIAARTGSNDPLRLTSPYHPYRLKLAAYFPDGRKQSGLLVVARVNGAKPVRLILDTGADGIFIDRRYAQAAGVERMAADRISGAGTASEESAWLGLAGRITIGSLEMENSLVHVTEKSPFPNADGVIGLNIFEKFLLRLDPAARVLDLIPFDDEADGSPAAADTIQILRVRNLLLVNPLVDGRQDRYFLLDTGASFSGTTGNDITGSAGGKTGGLEVDVRGAAGRVDGVFAGRPMRVTMGARQFVDNKPVQLDLSELSHHEGVEISGIIGYPLLEKSVLTINYRAGLIGFGQPKP